MNCVPNFFSRYYLKCLQLKYYCESVLFVLQVFTVLRMDEGDEEMDSNLNVECRKLGFPEFYTDLHDEHEDCICLADWKSVPYEMEIFRSLLRYFLLRSRNTDAVDSAVQTDINDGISFLLKFFFSFSF